MLDAPNDDTTNQLPSRFAGDQPIVPAPQPPGRMVIVAAPQTTPLQPSSRKWLWIGLAVLAAVLVVGTAGGVYALAQYNQPASVASQFCQDLKAQNFDSAYAMLSAKLQAQYDSGQFHQLNETLDAVEGNVTACGTASGSGSYEYSLGSDTATVEAVITRATQGKLQGAINLVSQGSWKIDALDTSLLGINPVALQMVGAFCAAMQSQSYDALYDLLASALRGQTQKIEYVALGQLQDLLNGKVTACAIKTIPSGNTDTTTAVTITVTRATLGASTGTITLDTADGGWKISKIDDSIQGTNLQPLFTASQFCLDIALGDFAGAYALTSSAFQAAKTQAQLAQIFALPAGGKWLACVPDMATYRVTGSQAQFSGQLFYFDASQALHEARITLFFTEEGGTWKVDDIQLSRS